VALFLGSCSAGAAFEAGLGGGALTSRSTGARPVSKRRAVPGCTPRFLIHAEGEPSYVVLPVVRHDVIALHIDSKWRRPDRIDLSDGDESPLSVACRD
jgi:hypothetical protein